MNSPGKARSRITNVWAKSGVDPVCRRGWSRVIIESDGPAELEVERSDSGIFIFCPDSLLLMAEDNIHVYDGLVTSVEVKRCSPYGVKAFVGLEHPADFSAFKAGGIPFRNIIEFDRGQLSRILEHVILGIDPGHGGMDIGARGPVNLVEKKVVWDIARFLKMRALELGAGVVMTRDGDSSVPVGTRIRKVMERGADVLVSIHAYGSRDEKIEGPRTLYYPDIPGSRELAEYVQKAITEKLKVPGRGCVAYPGKTPPGLTLPAIVVEAATISNWVDEGALRSPVFKERVAIGILTGLKRYLAREGAKVLPAATALLGGMVKQEGRGVRQAKLRVNAIPIRTHVVTEKDDLVELARRYTEGIAETGDVVVFAESVVAITQGRAILPEKVKPGALARFLCRFPGKDGSLATPPAMQLAINEVGTARVLLGVMAAGAGRLLGRRGDFFRVAGRSLALIDDIAGTMPPYDKHVVLGPKDADKLVACVKEALSVDAAIADVNDMGNVDILGYTDGINLDEITAALATNPFGNDDQQTPIVVLKFGRRE